MAEIHGMPGEWARVKGMVYGLWPLFLGVFAAGFAFGMTLSYPIFGAALVILSLTGCSWAMYRGLRHVDRYYKGARGEERVSAILRSLPDGYHVFNDFATGSGHVDHVVVGPAGVFAVETKNWSGKVTLEGERVLVDGRLPDRAPLKQVEREAAAVKKALSELGWSGPVTPVLTFASDTFEAKVAELHGSVIINANHLRKSFDTEKTVIAPPALERLVKLMLG